MRNWGVGCATTAPDVLRRQAMDNSWTIACAVGGYRQAEGAYGSDAVAEEALREAQKGAGTRAAS